jgi:hypothetical protein
MDNYNSKNTALQPIGWKEIALCCEEIHLGIF